MALHMLVFRSSAAEGQRDHESRTATYATDHEGPRERGHDPSNRAPAHRTAAHPPTRREDPAKPDSSPLSSAADVSALRAGRADGVAGSKTTNPGWPDRSLTTRVPRLMRKRGLEPPRPCERWNLNPVRLPIPPLPRGAAVLRNRPGAVKRGSGFGGRFRFEDALGNVFVLRAQDARSAASPSARIPPGEARRQCDPRPPARVRSEECALHPGPPPCVLFVPFPDALSRASRSSS